MASNSWRSMLILCSCLFLDTVNAKNHVFKFDRTQFQGEVTLNHMFVDDVANSKAEKVEAAVQRIFGRRPISFDQLNIAGTCARDFDLIKSAWRHLESCKTDSNCAKDHAWTKIILDAQGRRPSGLESGNQYWLGSYQQCIGDPIQQKLRTRYCKIVIPARTVEDVLFGICAPKSCSNNDVAELVSTFVGVRNFTVDCQEEADVWKDPSAIIAIAIFCSFSVLLLVATGFEIKVLKQHLAKHEGKVKSVQNVLIRGHHRVEETQQQNTWKQILLSFSCLSNGAKVFSTKRSPGQIDCMHGMRVISLLHVIVYHSVIIIRVVDNPVIVWTIHGAAKAMTTAGMMPVDTFFVLSGLTLSYNWHKEMSKSDQAAQIRTPLYWFKFYFYRYIRLTVPYAMVIWYYSEIFRYTGSSPLWPTEGHYCNGTWWHNLLYINNYKLSPCMLWTWYLAADFQLFVLSPLILIPLLVYPKAAYGLCAFLITICMVARGIVFGVNDYPPNSVPGLLKYDGFTGFFESQDLVYMRTQYRYSPYLIGLLAGRIIFNMRKEQRPKSAKGHWKKLCWTLTTLYWFLQTLLPYSIDYMPPWANGIYSGVTRTVWSIFVAWVVHECVSGSAKYVNAILSWSFWLPLSRLSYSAFLIHGLAYFYMRDTADAPFHFHSFLTPVFAFFVCCILTFLMATVVALAFEMPALELNKLLIKRSPCNPRPVIKSTKIGSTLPGAQAV